MSQVNRPENRSVVIAASVIGVSYLAMVLWALAVRSPLGHDESVYALRSRDLLTGWTHLSGDYWRDYRAPGMPMMLNVLGRVIGIHVTTARAFVAVLGLVTIVSTALLGRRLLSTWAGLGAAALLTLTYGFTFTATTLLADTAGAAFAMIAIAVFVADAQKGRLRAAWFVVPVMTVMSTLSRFGAPFMLGSGLLAAAVVIAPTARRARNRVLVVQAAILALVTIALVGFVLLTDTFSLDGNSPARSNSDLVDVNSRELGTGFRDLLNVVNPWSGHLYPMWSKPVGGLMLVGVVAALVSLVFDRTRARIVVFGVMAGTISVVCTVFTVRQIVPNYLVLTVPFWALVAATGLDWLVRTLRAWRALPAAASRAGMVVLGVVLFGALALDVGTDMRQGHRSYVAAYENIVAGSVATHVTFGDSCVLVSRYTPQAAYYSRCRIAPYRNYELAPDESLADSVQYAVDRWDLGSPPDPAVAVMLVQGLNRQPGLTELASQPELFEQLVFEAGPPGEYGQHVLVYEVAQCVVVGSCITGDGG